MTPQPASKKILLVSYDLDHATPEQYESVIETLKSSPGWWHYLQSTWLLSTRETPEQLADRVRKGMHPKDKILIIEVTNSYQGWLPKKAWEWLNTHLPED